MNLVDPFYGELTPRKIKKLVTINDVGLTASVGGIAGATVAPKGKKVKGALTGAAVVSTPGLVHGLVRGKGVAKLYGELGNLREATAPMSKAGSIMEKEAINWAGLGTKALGWVANNPRSATALARGAVGAAVGGVSAATSGGNAAQGALTGAGIGAATALLPGKKIISPSRIFEMGSGQKFLNATPNLLTA